MHDEGPSQDDLDRFSGETGFCTDCGEEIWDGLDTCPRCGAYLSGGVSSRPPVEREFQRRWIVVIIVLVLIAFLILVL